MKNINVDVTDSILKESVLNLKFQQQRISETLNNCHKIPDDNFFKLNKLSIDLLNLIIEFDKQRAFLAFLK